MVDFYRGDGEGRNLQNVKDNGGLTPKYPIDQKKIETWVRSQLASSGPDGVTGTFRASSQKNVIATAFREEDMHLHEPHHYRVHIADVELRLRVVEKDGGFGPLYHTNDAVNNIDKFDHYVIYNGNTIDSSSLVAFCSKRNKNREATFLTPIDFKHITGYRRDEKDAWVCPVPNRPARSPEK